jgi:hypothetical protein
LSIEKDWMTGLGLDEGVGLVEFQECYEKMDD